MWILLTKKLPTKPSPPKLSIFWAVPWPHNVFRGSVSLDPDGDMDEDDFDKGLMFWPINSESSLTINGVAQPPGFYTQDPDWRNAVRIHYLENDIRLYPHEFTELSAERMRDYIFGLRGEEIPSHEFMSESVATDNLTLEITDGDLRPIYDAALLDGCTKEQAFMTAMGSDITDAELEFAPIGWYRCKPEFAEVFCELWEMEETPALTKEELQEIEDLKKQRDSNKRLMRSSRRKRISMSIF